MISRAMFPKHILNKLLLMCGTVTIVYLVSMFLLDIRNLLRTKPIGIISPQRTAKSLPNDLLIQIHDSRVSERIESKSFSAVRRKNETYQSKDGPKEKSKSDEQTEDTSQIESQDYDEEEYASINKSIEKPNLNSRETNEPKYPWTLNISTSDQEQKHVIFLKVIFKTLHFLNKEHSENADTTTFLILDLEL